MVSFNCLCDRMFSFVSVICLLISFCFSFFFFFTFVFVCLFFSFVYLLGCLFVCFLSCYFAGEMKNICDRHFGIIHSLIIFILSLKYNCISLIDVLMIKGSQGNSYGKQLYLTCVQLMDFLFGLKKYTLRMCYGSFILHRNQVAVPIYRLHLCRKSPQPHCTSS